MVMLMKNKMKILILGQDGYIGHPLTLKLLMQNHRVIGIDNFSRRSAVKEMNSISASSIKNEYDRHNTYHRIGNFLFFKLDTIHNVDSLEKIIKRHKPDCIVNLAHNPSAPYSHIDRLHAQFVLNNNILGTNNLLWLIKEHCPDCHYITIGSTGEYAHNLNVDIEEGYFTFNHKGRTSKQCLFPRKANSIYHTSKVASTYLIDYLTNLWDLRCTDVMQSIVYGLYTPECVEFNDLTRLDSDDCFGTVFNRFIVQSIIGTPLTIYGHGLHQRAFLSLNDSIQALNIAINNPPKKGKVQTWNQLSEWYTIKEVAHKVKEKSKSNIQFIESPRKEFTGGHYYKFVTEKLKALGYQPTRTMKEEIDFMIKTINLTDKQKEILKNVVKPKVIF
jgi:UDP-sulfoquinovose synthase